MPFKQVFCFCVLLLVVQGEESSDFIPVDLSSNQNNLQWDIKIVNNCRQNLNEPISKFSPENYIYEKIEANDNDFIVCLFQKSGIFNSEGKLVAEKIAKVFVIDQTNAEDIAKKCNLPRGSKLADQALNFMRCASL
ncbi:uncharacterized protein LOC114348138 [Diabrotica virgifera virgifera]|uniref:Uncharacterized protein LOC114348138 n=1 Tax=Diabrotica virgifera virgifera TaxID=50390 RepID=A0A6P7HA76_DIAVI|nr:uncharacterized protein LOC114348138 [Diabrotica virgifera virgifera]